MTIYFEQHPISHQNQADHIHGQLHLASLPFLAKEFLGVAAETFGTAV
jgi:hypothetical protein